MKRSNDAVRRSLAVLCSLLLPIQQSFPFQQQQGQQNNQQPPPLSPDQLDSLVAPIALYPDQLLSQILVASTYPLEIVQADRWLKQQTNLQGKALMDAAAKQPWDASVQALVAFPDALKQLDTGINWTTDLGNAFLAQESDVMEAVQRLRKRAQQNGKLQSTTQQKVSTTTENNTQYVVIQPADPQVIYVPQYNPTVIWGAPPAYYPYPPIYYPPVSTGAVIAASAISFGVGMAVGAMWSGGGGWGWNAGWGHNNVTVNNNFISHNNFSRTSVTNGNAWQHNSAHRAGVPYSNRNVANRYNSNNFNGGNRNQFNGGNRNQVNGGNRNQVNRPTANQTQQRLGQANRPNGAGNAGQRVQAEQRNQGMQQRNQGLNQNAGRQSNSGASDRMGNRQVGGGSSGRSNSAYSGINQGGGRTQMNSNRGAASAGRSRGGGGGGGRRH